MKTTIHITYDDLSEACKERIRKIKEATSDVDIVYPDSIPDISMPYWRQGGMSIGDVDERLLREKITCQNVK